MGIRQQTRTDAPRPEVQETDYGAQFVKVATETKDTTLPEEEAVQVKEEAPADEAQEESKPAVKAKKKGGRPKKAR